MLLVAFTARTLKDDKTRSLEAGFDVHCAKPLTPDRLLTVLESIGFLRAKCFPNQ